MNRKQIENHQKEVVHMSRKEPTYEEYYMKALIEKCLPEFKSLILSDKPDLITRNKKIGIEVALCLPKDDKKFESLMFKRKRKPLVSGEIKWLHEYHKTHSIVLSDDNEEFVELVSKMVERKIGKKEQYTKTGKFGLAFVSRYIGEEQEAAKAYKEIFEQFKQQIDFLIVDIIDENCVIYIDKEKGVMRDYQEFEYDIAARATKMNTNARQRRRN